MTTPLQQAQQDWKAKTTEHPKQHFYKNGKKQDGLQHFRKYDQAIALINWDGEHIEITKLEKLPGTSKGAAIPLVDFLKALAVKYGIRITGQVKPYTPDPPWTKEPPITQEQLEAWYKKLGFRLFSRDKHATTWIWYPDFPPNLTDDNSGCLPA